MFFTKMQSMGNDYVYILLFGQEIRNPRKLAKLVSNRHYGIGSDGMVLISPSKKADFRMRIFNPDGSEAEMCGNALRSSAMLVYEKGIYHSPDAEFETLGGIKQTHLHLKNGKVENISANIGTPVLTGGICSQFTAIDKDFLITPLSLGNPHCAVETNDTENIEIKKYGHFLENHEMFPNKANIHFYEIIDRKTIKIRSWERNCGETLSCGTGCASCTYAALKSGKTERSVDVIQRGGVTHIFVTANDEIIMTGKSKIVFEGSFVCPEEE